MSKIGTAECDSVFKPTIVLMCGRTAAALAAFLIPVLLARVFAPGDFGTYKQVFLIYATLYGLCQFGMAESLYYFLPRNPQETGRYIVNSVLILLSAGLLAVLLLTMQAERIAQWLNNADLLQYMPLVGWNLVFMMASAPLEMALISRKRYGYAAVLYASDILRVAFYTAPVLIWGSLRSLLIGALIFGIMRFALSIFYFSRKFASQFKPSWLLLKKQFAYTLPFQLAIFVEVAQTNLHMYAVAHYFSAAAFAVYSVGCLQIPLIDFFASPAGNVMMVLMGEEREKGKREAVLALWHDTTRKLALIFLPAAVLLMALARDLIPFIFTPVYRDAVPIFAIWMVTVAITMFQTDAVLRVFAATRFLLILNVIRLGTVASLLYLMIPSYGIVGAVTSAVIAMAIAKLIALIKIRHLMKVGVSALLPWRRLGYIFGAAVIAAAGPFIITGTPLHVIPKLAVSGIVYSATYVGILWHTVALTAAEKTEIRKRVNHYLPSWSLGRFTSKAAGSLSQEWKG